MHGHLNVKFWKYILLPYLNSLVLLKLTFHYTLEPKLSAYLCYTLIIFDITVYTFQRWLMSAI